MMDRFEISLEEEFILVQLVVEGVVVERMKCLLHVDIPYCCRHLGRNYDKFGRSDSSFAEWFRMRQERDLPKGEVYYYSKGYEDWILWTVC